MAKSIKNNLVLGVLNGSYYVNIKDLSIKK